MTALETSGVIAKLKSLLKNGQMHSVILDGSDWRSEADFYDELAVALGSFDGHGRNADAFEETMIYYLELNAVQPPYEVVIKNARDELLPFLHKFASWIEAARRDRREDPSWGNDVEVSVTVA